MSTVTIVIQAAYYPADNDEDHGCPELLLNCCKSRSQFAAMLAKNRNENKKA